MHNFVHTYQNNNLFFSPERWQKTLKNRHINIAIDIFRNFEISDYSSFEICNTTYHGVRASRRCLLLFDSSTRYYYTQPNVWHVPRRIHTPHHPTWTMDTTSTSISPLASIAYFETEIIQSFEISKESDDHI